MKIAHICHLSSSSGVSALPSNLNKQLNSDKNFLSTSFIMILIKIKKIFFSREFKNIKSVNL